MPLKTLDDVVQHAFDRPQFLDDLVSDYHQALSKMGWELSSDDQSKLEELIQYRLEVAQAAKALIELIARSGLPWPPPPWSPVHPWPQRQPWSRKPEWPPRQ
jgi:hypothetical protein